MNEVTRLYNQMLVNLEQGIKDLDKFNDGNKAAGTRVRKNFIFLHIFYLGYQLVPSFLF